MSQAAWSLSWAVAFWSLVGGGPSAGPPAELWAFVSPTCGPCRQMEGVLNQLVARGVPIKRIDVTRQPDLARRLGIQAVPTFLVMSGQRAGPRIVGATSLEALEELYRQAGGVGGGGISGSQAVTSPVQGQVAGGAEGRDEAAPAEGGVIVYARTAAELLGATVRLRVRDERGQSCGSGTIVDARGGEALILTCGHIFRESRGAGRIEVDLFAPEPVENLPGRLVGYDLTRDLGLVVIRPPGPVVVARIAPAGTQLRAGMAVISVGCDHGSRPTAQYTRVVAVDKYVGPANVVVSGMPSEGRSGGGLFTEEGLLVGVCNAADPAEKEGLFSALPAIHELLEARQLAFVYKGPFPAAGGWPSAKGTGPLLAQRQSQGTGGNQPASGEGSPGRGLAEGGGAVAGGGQSAGTTGGGLTAAEEALLARLAQHLYQGAEVLWVVRPRAGEGTKGEVLAVEGVSPAFWERLAELAQGLPQKTSCQVDKKGPETPRAAEPSWGPSPRRRVLLEFHSQLPIAR